MSKRFIDTSLFDDDWFMDLPKDAKLLWVYFITKCDHAGMLKLNLKLCKVQTEVKDLNETIIQLGNRIVTVSEHLYFIPKFIEFQYPGFPNSKAKAQISAIAILKKYNLLNEDDLTVIEPLPNSYGNNNNNGYIKDNDKGKDKSKMVEFILPTLEEVEIYFGENGYSQESAIKAFNYYSIADWHDSKGNKIRNWKQKMQAVWFKDENKVKSGHRVAGGYYE